MTQRKTHKACLLVSSFVVRMKIVYEDRCTRRRIPFEIKASTKEQINKDAGAAFLEMRATPAEAGLQDMTLDEINAEIQEVRGGR